MTLAAERGARATAVRRLRRIVSCRVSRRPWPTATYPEHLPKPLDSAPRPGSRRRPGLCLLFRVVRASGRPTVSGAGHGPRLIEASGARRRAAAAARRPAAARGRTRAAPRNNQGARSRRGSLLVVLTSCLLVRSEVRSGAQSGALARRTACWCRRGCSLLTLTSRAASRPARCTGSRFAGRSTRLPAFGCGALNAEPRTADRLRCDFPSNLYKLYNAG